MTVRIVGQAQCPLRLSIIKGDRVTVHARGLPDRLGTGGPQRGFDVVKKHIAFSFTSVSTGNIQGKPFRFQQVRRETMHGATTVPTSHQRYSTQLMQHRHYTAINRNRIASQIGKKGQKMSENGELSTPCDSICPVIRCTRKFFNPFFEVINITLFPVHIRYSDTFSKMCSILSSFFSRRSTFSFITASSAPECSLSPFCMDSVSSFASIASRYFSIHILMRVTIM